MRLQFLTIKGLIPPTRQVSMKHHPSDRNQSGSINVTTRNSHYHIQTPIKTLPTFIILSEVIWIPPGCRVLSFTGCAHSISVLYLAGIQNTTKKCNLGKKGFIWLSLPNHSLHEWKSGRNSRQDSWGQNWGRVHGVKLLTLTEPAYIYIYTAMASYPET